MLARSSMKNDQQLVDTLKTRIRNQKTASQENVICCEITSIGEKNKNVILPQSKTNSSSDNMPNIRRPDRFKSATVRRDATECTTLSKDQLSIGLSDMGSNGKFPLPHRPLTTGRLLPHISRKHLKDSTALLSKPTVVSGTKLSTFSRKTGSGYSRTTPSNLNFQGLEKSDKTTTSHFQSKSNQPVVVSSIGVKNSPSMATESPNNLQSTSGLTKLAPTPPTRKLVVSPKTNSISAGIGINTSLNTKHSASAKGRKLTSEPEQYELETSRTDKLTPASNFKSIISVTNLELGNDKSILKTNRSLNVPSESNRLGERVSLSRERKSRVRHSHPPTTLPMTSSKLTTLATVLKPEKLDSK